MAVWDNQSVGMVGAQFGRWTVLQKDEAPSNKVYFLCRCTCGVEKRVESYALRKGKSTSCGCRVKERRPAVERFLAQFTPGAEGECWDWARGFKSTGYGSFHDDEWRDVGAHRFSFEHFHRKLLPGEYVCHTCDNRKCINPSHLFAGSPADNMRDMYRKKRGCFGARCKAAKLTEKEAIEIFEAEGKQREIAERFGVSIETVNGIKNQRTWVHATHNRARAGRVNEPHRDRRKGKAFTSHWVLESCHE